MNELTKIYYDYTNKNFTASENEAIEVLKGVIEQSPSIRKDIEGLMTIIKNLEDAHYKSLITSKFNDINNIDPDLLNLINLKTQAFIRESLEKIAENSFEFLTPLEGFLDDDPIEIFTLNYDGLLDLFCERHNIKYSDGFSPYWDPDEFNNKSINIKMYGLHGCLYWFKPFSGKNIRIPLIGLDLDKVNYISSERLSEIVIYPTIKKEKSSHIYSWLNNRFIESIQDCKLLIIIGYSFRDDDISSIIKDVLHSHNMWILIISPDAKELAAKFFEIDDLGVRSRVMYINSTFESILNRGNLFNTVSDLLLNINSEKKVLNIYNQTPRKNNPIYLLIDRYIYLGCHERVNYLKQLIKPFYSEHDLEEMFKLAYEREVNGKLEYHPKRFIKYLNNWSEWDW